MHSELAGRWRAEIAGRAQELEISASGEARLVGAPYLLLVIDRALVVPQLGHSYPFELRGDTLTLKLDGAAVAFSRVRAD